MPVHAATAALASSGTPALAIDGDATTQFLRDSSASGPSWLQLDLGSTKASEYTVFPALLARFTAYSTVSFGGLLHLRRRAQVHRHGPRRRLFGGWANHLPGS